MGEEEIRLCSTRATIGVCEMVSPANETSVRSTGVLATERTTDECCHRSPKRGDVTLAPLPDTG